MKPVKPTGSDRLRRLERRVTGLEGRVSMLDTALWMMVAGTGLVTLVAVVAVAVMR